MWKRGEIAPKEQFLLFSTIFSVYLYFQESNYIFIYEMWLFELFFFLKSANLICRDTDISKYFRGSPGLRDNESRLYINCLWIFLHNIIMVLNYQILAVLVIAVVNRPPPPPTTTTTTTPSRLRILRSQICLQLEVKVSSWLYTTFLHGAFLYHHSIVSIWLK